MNSVLLTLPKTRILGRVVVTGWCPWPDEQPIPFFSLRQTTDRLPKGNHIQWFLQRYEVKLMRNLFYGSLFNVLLTTTNRTGSAKLGWRAVRFVHSIPFALGATVLGYLAGMVWGISPPLSAALCCGGFYALAAWDWFKEWRRG